MRLLDLLARYLDSKSRYTSYVHLHLLDECARETLGGGVAEIVDLRHFIDKRELTRTTTHYIQDTLVYGWRCVNVSTVVSRHVFMYKVKCTYVGVQILDHIDTTGLEQ